ncbi:hypothetical protein ALQ72_100849 [Pseudomonas syringae pv. maculicola]|uniref:Uncharacterized protein n=1 Tax=Pseudomonas syringae pv. maculicola TaxID=59511 RepID=A0A0N0WW29_PSEYM|nr:Unknown protein sequence [Pseudomonas syringae pv. maculicola str. M6]KPC02623.1 Unknown protein sequence [Pseudomonas syringae pv. maculicola]KPC12669.1 Unknown protein sequence [Pseudomonas amygdali pv. lachrymans]KPX74319.1 hypothetical protein ALO84_102245 [Pseudomonas syringae pv. maculicola]RMM80728.1 hypothetical protein ALQ72_100849 [Pseudomonas syringae pv. maculicola]
MLRFLPCLYVNFSLVSHPVKMLKLSNPIPATTLRRVIKTLMK